MREENGAAQPEASPSPDWAQKCSATPGSALLIYRPGDLIRLEDAEIADSGRLNETYLNLVVRVWWRAPALLSKCAFDLV